MSSLCLLGLLVLPGYPRCIAQATTLLLPAGVAYDSAGNLFVADARKNQVFEVSLAGVTTVIAGTGRQGFSGDGGDATLALLNSPASVAIAKDGTIYIADTGNQRIRAIASGQIQTIAGSGAKGFSGDGSDARTAKLNAPLALAIDDSGALLIADSGNHRLRRLSAGILTTIAGNGVQGFSGDGFGAASAQMDAPAGVAVASDGRIFVADSHNQRIRVIATDGTIATFAGTGVRGFSGDGGAAASAALFLPRGMAITPAGELIFADSDNQRLRQINAQGIITTIAGNGVQGGSAEGAAAKTTPLDSPRAVAISGFSAPVFADAHNHAVREVAPDADLYTLLGGVSHAATVTLAAPAALTYGQGIIGATISGAAPTPQGSLTLLDGGKPAGTATLLNAVTELSTDTLPAGPHTLTAAFTGDGLHPAAVSSAVTVSVAPAAVTAKAQAATMPYGGITPALTGTLSGVLTRDITDATATFASSAPDLSPAGTYPITAALSGSASPNYTLTLDASSGTLQIVPATASVIMNTPQISYVGLPVTMSASVSSATRGFPTGNVNFLDNGAVVATGTVAGGVVTAIYLNPGAGPHAISASYAGDHNFLPATSAALPITVSAMPDFALSVTGNATQTIQSGATAIYPLQILSQPAPFSGSVSMSASGLPPGAAATFSPGILIPGNTPATVSLNIQTTALVAQTVKAPIEFAALVVFGLSFGLMRRRPKLLSALWVALIMLGLSSSIGCGDRSFPTSAHASQSFPITVTATSTNLAGGLVVHTAQLVLVVD